MVSRAQLQQEWEQRLKEFHASGQTATAWCAANNVNLHQLWCWPRKLRAQRREDTKNVQWLSVNVNEPSPQEFTLVVQVCSTPGSHQRGSSPTLRCNQPFFMRAA